MRAGSGETATSLPGHARTSTPTPGSDIRKLRDELNALAKSHEVLAEAVDDLNEQGGVNEEPPPPDPVAAGAAAAEAQVQTLNERFNRQEADPIWADEAESALHRRFTEDEVPGITLSEADCRADMCRLRIDFDAPGAREAGMRNIPFLLPWQGEAFFAIEPETGLSATIYYAREGRSLPRSG